MKKQILVPIILSSLGVALLASCSLKTSENSTPSSLEQEVVSSALLSQKSNPALQLKKETSTTVTAEGSLSFNPSDPSATLASFDNFALDDYSIKTNVLTSDKEDYEHKDEIVYTLPDGTSKSVILYYGESKIGSVDASAELSTTTSTSTGSSESTERSELHLYGYRNGGFEGMLNAGWSFEDEEDETNVSVSGTWKYGLAYVEGAEYRFHAEEMTLTKDGKNAEMTSFGLFGQGSFLAVEQAVVTNGSETGKVYAYTAFQNATFTRYLLAESATARRLVYRTSLNKLVINRYEKDGKTLYSIHVKVVGSMSLVGVYEKVVSVASDGTESVSYVLHQDTSDAPSED
jgi:hypothetical protein